MFGAFGLGTLVATLAINTRPLDIAEKRVAGFAGRTSTLMASVRRSMLIVFSGVGISKLAKSFLDAAVSVENYKLSLNAVIKDVKKTESVFADLKHWAAINPIDTDDAIASYVRLKTAAVSNTREAVAAAADAATVMHTRVEYVANAMVSTNNKTLRMIGVQLDRMGKKAIIRSGQFRVETTKDIDAIRQGIIKVLQLNFGGAMEAAKNTWRGSINTMKGLWFNFKADVMGTSDSGGPFSVLLSEIHRVRDAWIEWQTGADKESYLKFVENMQRVFSASIRGMIAIIEGLVTAFNWAIENLDLLKKAFVVFASIKGAGSAIAVMTYFRREFMLGMALVPTATSLVSKLGVAFLSLRTAPTILGGVKGALLALGLSPGGLLIAAIGGLILLAESMKGSFEAANERIREFRSELNSVPLEKLQKMVDMSQSMGGFGIGGWKASEEIANRGMESTRKAAEEALAVAEKKRKEALAAAAKYNREQGLDEYGDPIKMGGGESKYIGLIQKMRDQMKYLNVTAKEFLPILDGWLAKMTPLSDDWKLVKDLSMEIRANLSKVAGEKTAAMLERIEKQIELQEEAKQSALEGASKFWNETAQGYAQGLIEGEQYFEMLSREFESLKQQVAAESGGFLDMENFYNWTGPIMDRFTQMQSAAQELAQTQLEPFTKQLDLGKITMKEWVKEVDALIAKYAHLPLVVEWLNKTLETTQETSKGLVFSAKEWVDALSSGLADAIVQGESLADVLRNIARQIASMAIKGVLSNIFGKLFGLNANGNVYGSSGLVPFAKGGVVGSPTIFPFAGGVGVMGEKGAEAIMPLKRNSQGKLGVVASGSDNQGNSEGSGSTHITMNINAVDSRSFVEMMRTNKAGIESIVVENIMKNGAVRSAIRGMA